MAATTDLMPAGPDSDAGRPERDQDTDALAEQLAKAYREMAAFYRDQWQLENEDPWERAAQAPDPEARRERMLREPPDQVSWIGLQQLEAGDAGAAMDVWRHLKTTARKRFATGAYASEPFTQLSRPWDRARFVALVEAFTAEWQPAVGIETALVDMLAQQYTMWQFWLGALHARATLESRLEDPKLRDSGFWQPPRLDAGAAMDQAAAMTDRFNRLFLRTLRALRDYRRYAMPPVVVENAGQVNIGQQQVNVATSTPATGGAG